MSGEMVFGDFVEDCGRQNNWTDSTYEKFAAVKNHLTNFRKALTFEFFDERGLNDYVSYLHDVKEMRNTTIGKQLSFLKWFLRWAFKKGVHQTTPMTTISLNSRVHRRKSFFSLGTNSTISESSKSLPTNRLLNVCVISFSSNALQICAIRMYSIPAEVILKATILKLQRFRLPILFHPIADLTCAVTKSIQADYTVCNTFCQDSLTLLDELWVKTGITVAGSRYGYLTQWSLDLLLHFSVTTVTHLTFFFCKMASVSPSRAAFNILFNRGAKAPSLPNKGLPACNCSMPLFLILSKSNSAFIKKLC